VTRPQIIREPGDLTGRLQAARQARGLSQQAFALYERFDRTQLSRWENGTEPSLSNAIRLARALGYDLALVPRQER
jgi:transcriptional regulator with XRE-family HTH domain